MSAGTWREDLYAEKEEVGKFGNFFRLKGVWGEAEIRNYQKVNFLQPCRYIPQIFYPFGGGIGFHSCVRVRYHTDDIAFDE